MRGQAFDTFKLMIAAVVAVAILGILLSILGGISFSGQGFENTAKQLLSTCSMNPGLVKPSAGEVNFQKDTTYPASIFTTAAGGRKIEFDVATSLGESVSVSPSGSSSGDSLTIHGNFHSKIYVCCEEDIGGVCKIGIAKPVSC